MRNIEDIATTRTGITMVSYTASREANCYWDGTAPFCAGSCPSGYNDCGTSSCGDGACCMTGYKKYCCLGACS